MCTVPRRRDFDLLLRGFLAGNRAARETLPRVAERYVLRIAHVLCADLPEDLYGEVANQAFLNLMRQKPSSYNPARGAAGTFLKLMVRNALRQVRASYAPPGHVTRVRKAKDSQKRGSSSAPAVVSLDDLKEKEVDILGVDNDMTPVEAQLDMNAMLRRAPERVALGLKRLYVHGDTMKQAAASVGMSRFTLSRQISEFVRQERLAA